MKEKLHIRSGAEGLAFMIGQPQRPLAPHHHAELEVNLILSGKASYLVRNQRIPLSIGSMIWLFPKQEHVLINCSHDFSMWVLVFKSGLVERRAGEGTRAVLSSSDPGEIFCRQIEAHPADFLDQVYRDASGENLDQPAVNAALEYGFVASWEAYQFSEESLPGTDVHPAVAKAARLVAGTDEPLPLPQLAQKAGLSAARLSRLFKQQTGTSLTAFRQRKYLERFLRLYRTGARYSLVEAALLAGFGSYPQFHRVFCRLMKMNPAAYRKTVAGARAKSD